MSQYKCVTVDALVVGSGAAGYHASCRIRQEGVKHVTMVTEGVSNGTSRNTGSDKQTYYKLGLGGSCADSVRQMASDLFAGGCVDGDNALCEAALSTRCFLNLCELGVPFPVNRYGEYVGYKTDHDPYARATSAGPLTSRFMTEALEVKAKALGIEVWDNLYAVEVLKDGDGICGLLCMDRQTGEPVVFLTGNLVLATGGPAGIYADSVYPKGHTGSSSLAILAGANFQNMTEWQYGLASVDPRWNVSGTYMQVLPRFVSVDKEGKRREFLLDYFKDPYAALSAVFMKGYQWPFDSGKVMEGSSVIDLLVYRERMLLGRKVFLDYRMNPFGLTELEYARLSPEAETYLRKAEACFGRPIDRLLHMNTPAVELYRSKGVDLKTEMLEIALCAQHHNGGIAVDLWWQTCVPGLFAVGECAGTHGISRPGGSALNAGQVGSLRAAQYLAAHPRAISPDVRKAADRAVEIYRAQCRRFVEKPDSVPTAMEQAQRTMSASGGAIREPSAMERALSWVQDRLSCWEAETGVGSPDRLYAAYQYRDVLICQQVCLSAMLNYSQTVGATRGSALYYNEQGTLRPGLEEGFRFAGCPKAYADKIQQGKLQGDNCQFAWRPVRPMPEDNDFFENVWRRYRENKWMNEEEG